MTDMHPEDIKAEIRKRGSTLAALAAAVGMHKQVLSLALASRTSWRAEEAIAAFLEKPAASIWPSRYDAKGIRINLRRSKSEMEKEKAEAAFRKTKRKAAA